MENKKQELIEKIKKEYEDFTENMLEQDKVEIMSRGLETTIKTFVKNILTEDIDEYSEKEIDELLDIDNILEFFFQNYMAYSEYVDIEEVLAEFVFEILGDMTSEEEQD